MIPQINNNTIKIPNQTFEIINLFESVFLTINYKILFYQYQNRFMVWYLIFNAAFRSAGQTDIKTNITTLLYLVVDYVYWVSVPNLKLLLSRIGISPPLVVLNGSLRSGHMWNSYFRWNTEPSHTWSTSQSTLRCSTSSARWVKTRASSSSPYTPSPPWSTSTWARKVLTM